VNSSVNDRLSGRNLVAGSNKRPRITSSLMSHRTFLDDRMQRAYRSWSSMALIASIFASFPERLAPMDQSADATICRLGAGLQSMIASPSDMTGTPDIHQGAWMDALSDVLRVARF